MTDWTSNHVKTNGITLHYQRTGGAKPPLLLCHGFSDCHVAWTRTARALEDAFDLIIPDARVTGTRTSRKAATAPLTMRLILLG